MFVLNKKDILDVAGGEGVCKCYQGRDLVFLDKTEDAYECHRACCYAGGGRWKYEDEFYVGEEGGGC